VNIGNQIILTKPKSTFMSSGTILSLVN